MTPETKLKNDIMRYLNTLWAAGHPIWWVKIAGGPRQRAGLPDIHVTYRGRSIWLEIKAPGGNATPLQDATLKRIREAGGVAKVVRSVEEVAAAIGE